MAFKPSSYIDIKVNDPDKASKFYADALNWEKIPPQGHNHTFKFGALTIFVTKSDLDLQKSNVHFEMSTDENIEDVKKRLLRLGCNTCDSAMEKAYMFTDPFGNNIHIYQET